MENSNMKLDLPQISVPDMNRKIEKLSEESIIPMKEMFSELNGEDNSEVDNVLGDLFYKSVQLIFDTGFDLAKKLNLELFDSYDFESNKEK